MSKWPLDLIWDCASHPDPELNIETLEEQFEGCTDILVNLGLLQQARISSYVSCEICHTHIEEIFTMGKPGDDAKYYMFCEYNGLMEVPRKRLLRWKINYKPIVESVAGALQCRGRIQEVVKGSLWKLGFSFLSGISRMIYIVRNFKYLEENILAGQNALCFTLGPLCEESHQKTQNTDILELRNFLFLKNGCFDIDFFKNSVRGLICVPNNNAPNIFKPSGDSYTVRYNGGETFTLSTVDVGAGYIHKLLSHPGEFFSVAEIVLGSQVDIKDTALSNSGDIADQKAVREYRKQASDLLEELKEARANNDIGKVEILEEKLDLLQRAINESRGLNNRPRKAQSGRERIRKAFYSAYVRARKKIEEADPAFAEHLKENLSGGMNPVYRPPDGISWLT